MRYSLVLVTVISVALGVTVLLSYYVAGGQDESPKNPSSSATQDEEGFKKVPVALWHLRLLKDIDKVTKKANLTSLRTKELPKSDFEVRIWFMPGPLGTDGLVLNRTQNIWVASYVHGLRAKHGSDEGLKNLPMPKSGWDTAWGRLVDAGLLTIVDASELNCDDAGKDTIVYFVETNVNGTYRPYSYSNLDAAKCEDAKKMIQVLKVLNEEFGLDWPI